MTAVPPPPWGGRAAEPDRTPDGVEIHRTRFGAFTRNPDGPGWLPYQTPEEQAQTFLAQVRRAASRRREQPHNWSPWRG